MLVIGLFEQQRSTMVVQIRENAQLQDKIFTLKREWLSGKLSITVEKARTEVCRSVEGAKAQVYAVVIISHNYCSIVYTDIATIQWLPL
jgi:hypothetical protein